MRLACLYAPQIALQAVLRRDPERRQGAVALAAGPGERALVVGMTAAARDARVKRGMTVSQARAVASARLRSLTVIVMSPADTAAAESALADVGYAFASRVEVEPGRVFFDVGDLGSLYPAGERAIAQTIAAHAERVGLAVRVAVAASKGIARAATAIEDVTVVPEGEERAFLAPLALRTGLRRPDAKEDEELAAKLTRWGLRTLGDLAALPLHEVELRTGPEGGRLRRLAEGLCDETFAPRLPPDALEEATSLEWTVTDLEPLAFVLRGLIDRALGRLACRGLACAGLTLRLKLEPRGFDVRDVPIAAPTREAGPLLQLIRLDLARRPPNGGVVGAEIAVLPARVRAQQLDFLRPTGPAPERLAATMARLAALVGIENVGAPEPIDSYRDEDVRVAPWKPPAPRTPAPATEDDKTDRTLGLAIRRFRPPRRLDVLMGRDGPTALRAPDLAVRILVAAGPYRTSTQWWQDDGFSRDAWDVHASDGAVYRIHQDKRTGAWFLEGYYD